MALPRSRLATLAVPDRAGVLAFGAVDVTCRSQGGGHSVRSLTRWARLRRRAACGGHQTGRGRPARREVEEAAPDVPDWSWC